MTELEKQELIEQKEKIKNLEKVVENLASSVTTRQKHCDERRSRAYDRISALEQSNVRTEEKFIMVIGKLDTIIVTQEKMSEGRKMWTITLISLLLSPVFNAIVFFLLSGKVK